MGLLVFWTDLDGSGLLAAGARLVIFIHPFSYPRRQLCYVRPAMGFALVLPQLCPHFSLLQLLLYSCSRAPCALKFPHRSTWCWSSRKTRASVRRAPICRGLPVSQILMPMRTTTNPIPAAR